MKKFILLSVVLALFLLASNGFLFIQNQNLKNEIGILNNKIADLEK